MKIWVLISRDKVIRAYASAESAALRAISTEGPCRVEETILEGNIAHEDLHPHHNIPLPSINKR